MQSEKKPERGVRPDVRPEGRTAEEQLEQINNPPPPIPTQAEADALKEAAGLLPEQRDMKPANPAAGYTTR